jgi:hypothetical protein
MSPPYVYMYKPPCPAIMRPPEGPSGAGAGVPVFRSDVDPRSGRFDKALDRGGRHRRASVSMTAMPRMRAGDEHRRPTEPPRVGRARSPDGRDSSIKWSQRSKSASKHSQGARTGCAAAGALGKSGSGPGVFLETGVTTRSWAKRGREKRCGAGLCCWRVLWIASFKEFNRILD